MGGSAQDSCDDIAIDNQGSIYLTGFTTSVNFPTTPGAFDTGLTDAPDAFIVGFNPSTNSLSYSTYLGGHGYFDIPSAIAVDLAGRAYVVGVTWASDFPVTSGAFDTTRNGQEDVFVVRLNASGTALEYGTYLGGGAPDSGTGVAVDSEGRAYVSGLANSSNFPTTSNAFDRSRSGPSDAFVTLLNATGSALDYSTYLGGAGGSSQGFNLTIDGIGYAYVTGRTWSDSFPVTSNAFDASYNGRSDSFIAKLAMGITASPTPTASPT